MDYSICKIMSKTRIKMIKIIRIFFFIFLSTNSAVLAIETPRIVNWDNLVPEMAPIEYPLDKLTYEQRSDIEFLISTRNMRQQGIISKVDEIFEEGVEIRFKLVRQGIAVDEMLASYDQFIAEIEKRNRMVNHKLEGQLIRIPGFALPLEHKDFGVKDLLLVPYVGACIHVPPPPANQIVYVRLKDAHILDSVFEPVWITGRVTLVMSNKNLSFVDGVAGIETAYTLDGIKIEPYDE